MHRKKHEHDTYVLVSFLRFHSHSFSLMSPMVHVGSNTVKLQGVEGWPQREREILSSVTLEQRICRKKAGKALIKAFMCDAKQSFVRKMQILNI